MEYGGYYQGVGFPLGSSTCVLQSLNNELSPEVKSIDYLTLFSLVTGQRGRKGDEWYLSTWYLTAGYLPLAASGISAYN